MEGAERRLLEPDMGRQECPPHRRVCGWGGGGTARPCPYAGRGYWIEYVTWTAMTMRSWPASMEVVGAPPESGLASPVPVSYP